MVKGNTNLPIFIAAKIGRESIDEVLQLLPDGIIVGQAITMAENPRQEAAYFSDLIKNIG